MTEDKLERLKRRLAFLEGVARVDSPATVRLRRYIIRLMEQNQKVAKLDPAEVERLSDLIWGRKEET